MYLKYRHGISTERFLMRSLQIQTEVDLAVSGVLLRGETFNEIYILRQEIHCYLLGSHRLLLS